MFKRMILLFALLAMLTACANKAQQGAVGGATAGALIGALTAGNKVQGAAIGAGAGLLLGYIIGNELDKMDRENISNTLETTPSGQTTTWRNPDSGYYYQATPQAAYYQDDRIYRDVEIETTIDGRTEIVHAKAYRNPDGSWQLVQ